MVSLLLSSAVAACAAEARKAQGPAEIRAEPVDLYPLDPALRAIGRLTFEAGFALSSSGHALGGLSGLLVDGRDLFAVSDGGTLWRATLDLAPDGRLRGIGDWRAQGLRWPSGSPYAGTRLDAESLARAADGGLLISLEEVQAMLRLERSGEGPPVLEPYPAALRSAPSNEGVEALTDLQDGGLLTITEGLAAGPGTLRAAVLGLGSPVLLAYRPAPGFKPTAADRLGRHSLRPGAPGITDQRFLGSGPAPRPRANPTGPGLRSRGRRAGAPRRPDDL